MLIAIASHEISEAVIKDTTRDIFGKLHSAVIIKGINTTRPIDSVKAIATKLRTADVCIYLVRRIEDIPLADNPGMAMPEVTIIAYYAKRSTAFSDIGEIYVMKEYSDHPEVMLLDDEKVPLVLARLLPRIFDGLGRT